VFNLRRSFLDIFISVTMKHRCDVFEPVHGRFSRLLDLDNDYLFEDDRQKPFRRHFDNKGIINFGRFRGAEVFQRWNGSVPQDSASLRIWWSGEKISNSSTVTGNNDPLRILCSSRRQRLEDDVRVDFYFLLADMAFRNKYLKMYFNYILKNMIDDMKR